MKDEGFDGGGVGVLTPDGGMNLNGEYLQDRVGGSRRIPYQTAMDQPYLEDRNGHPHRGHACVRLREGLAYNNETGEYVPKYVERRIAQLKRAGVSAASWTGNVNTLPRQVWVHMIRDAMMVYRTKLVYWAAIRARSTEPGVDPYKSSTIEYEAISDPGEAFEDMEVINDGRNDSPVSKFRSQPLPMQYMNWHISDRLLRINENNGRPYTSLMNRFASRRIGELVEDGALGNRTGITFGTLSGSYANAHDGTSTNYGARNLTSRMTSTAVTLPTTVSAFNAETHYNEVLALIQSMRLLGFYGPYTLTYGTDWWPFINKNFSVSGGNNPGKTLLSMLESIPDISSVLIAPRLTATFQGFLTQIDGETVSAIDAMPPTLIQWDAMGGAKRNFRTLACQGTIWKYDYNGTAAHLHFTAA
jgi:hypothetical protein